MEVKLPKKEQEKEGWNDPFLKSSNQAHKY